VSTYDDNLSPVPFDPTPPAKTFSTFDAITALHTIEAPRNLIGDRQIFAGKTWEFDGSKWNPLLD
jgi:hypothetical protein